MKKVYYIAIIILVGALSFSGCIDENNKGTLILQITDANDDLNITEALVTISSITVHLGAGGNNTTEGWYTIVEEQQTFDLIELQDVKEFLGSENLTVGIYTQIRLNVDQALVTIDGVQHDLEIPSETVKLVNNFRIDANETKILTLDFEVQESIHETGNGKYIMKPTIKVIEE
jgi:hypothetical protein